MDEKGTEAGLPPIAMLLGVARPEYEEQVVEIDVTDIKEAS